MSYLFSAVMAVRCGCLPVGDRALVPACGGKYGPRRRREVLCAPALHLSWLARCPGSCPHPDTSVMLDTRGNLTHPLTSPGLRIVYCFPTYIVYPFWVPLFVLIPPAPSILLSLVNLFPVFSPFHTLLGGAISVTPPFRRLRPRANM